MAPRKQTVSAKKASLFKGFKKLGGLPKTSMNGQAGSKQQYRPTRKKHKW